MLEDYKKRVHEIMDELDDLLAGIEDIEGYNHNSYYTNLYNKIGEATGRKDITGLDYLDNEEA